MLMQELMAGPMEGALELKPVAQVKVRFQEYLWLKEHSTTKSLAELAVWMAAMKKVDDMVRVFGTDLVELEKKWDEKGIR